MHPMAKVEAMRIPWSAWVPAHEGEVPGDTGDPGDHQEPARGVRAAGQHRVRPAAGTALPSNVDGM
jgi:hypothetical protein